MFETFRYWKVGKGFILRIIHCPTVMPEVSNWERICGREHPRNKPRRSRFVDYVVT